MKSALHIMLIEEDESTANYIQEELIKAGYHDISLTHHYQSLDDQHLLQSLGLIFLPLQMSETRKTGIEVVQKIHTIKTIPIFITNDKVDLTLIRKAKALPHCKYFHKPLDVKEILAEIAQLPSPIGLAS